MFWATYFKENGEHLVFIKLETVCFCAKKINSFNLNVLYFDHPSNMNGSRIQLTNIHVLIIDL